MDELVQMAKEDKEIHSVRELLNLWVRTADKAFTQIFIVPEYATFQREMSATAMEFKIRAREVAEILFKAIDMPTRSELDDAYRTLYEVRKEVKALKKALKRTQAPAEHAVPVAPIALR
jgi:class III poly(R)-hydroxyalkanoic acid synthase PhaE subunit